MGTYLSGTTAEIWFAGEKIGDATGFTKEPTVLWNESDFVGNPVKQYIPIKVDATGTIERFVPDWRMFALTLGYTYYDESLGYEEFFKDGENNAEVLWRYLEVYDTNYNGIDDPTLPGDLPYLIAPFTARCPQANYLKLRMDNTGAGWSDGALVFEINSSPAGTGTSYATFTISDTSTVLTGSQEWHEIEAVNANDMTVGDEYYIILKSTGTTATGDLNIAKSFIYNTSPNIRSAFVLGLKQNANDEGFEIKVKHYSVDGELVYIEDFTGVKLTKSGFDITPMDLTKVSIDWYAAEYWIYKP